MYINDSYKRREISDFLVMLHPFRVEYNYIISRDNDCIFLQYADRKLLIKEVHCYA